MPYKLFLEGQEIALSDEVAATDDTLRNAMMPFFPEVGTADIRREEKNGITEIRMVKRAGTKGNVVVQSLIDSDGEVNPALYLSWQLKELERSGNLDMDRLISFQPQIAKAVDVGEDWENTVTDTLKALRKCQPIPSSVQVIGI
ncbi:hypothetical protein [Chlorogloea sp. CCALA 695]|uniref:hypothetical protein n=1 Tax=Chlorogloea sp. CCALA 695 TaxID=2107693 RepID=UPI000D066789|nr:hypothetical protein [Chlorogloea sp. CCALA 695]PSB28528.1 hypothetical protein C7B70_20820 [Chlorogloea sp. CCALA 695]